MLIFRQILFFLLIALITKAQTDTLSNKDSIKIIVKLNDNIQLSDTIIKNYNYYKYNKIDDQPKYIIDDPIFIKKNINKHEYFKCQYLKYFDDPTAMSNQNRVYHFSTLNAELTDAIFQLSKNKNRKKSNPKRLIKSP